VQGRPIVIALLLAAAIAAASWLLLRQPASGMGRAHAPEPNAAATPASTAGRAAGPASGRLRVESSVPGASVSVDGRALGTAPREAELGPGPHRLQVTKDGFVPYRVEVQVVPGHTSRVEARLDREPPRLRVDADVPGARVFLDRRFLGTTPVETREVPPGPHQLDVAAEGFDIHGETIDLGPDGREVVVRFKEVRLDETLAVTHKHGVGSCRGTLSANNAGLHYQASDASDTFSARFADLLPLQVDYLGKNLRVKLRGGRTYNFTADSADALLSFQKAVEAARKRL